MGKILTNNRITQANVEHYIQQATKDYSTFLASAPTFCTYYSKNHLKSTYDRSLENINEVIGADSPIKFDKIENLPIYKIDNASFATEITDFGISGTVSSSAILLPDTIVPMSDDVFILEYQNARKVFQVTDVEQDNYNNSKFFKISFRLSTFNIEDTEKQVNGEFTVDYNLIGQQKNPVVKKTAFELALALEDIFDILAKDYLFQYYDRQMSAFVDKLGDRFGRAIVDPLLNRFIADEKLHELYKDYRNFHYLNDSLSRSVRPADTNRSLYGVLQSEGSVQIKDKLDQGFTQRTNVIRPAGNERYSINWFSRTGYYLSLPVKEGVTPAVTDEVVSPFTEEFLKKVTENDSVEDNPYKKFLIRAFGGYYTETTYHEIPADVGFLDDYADNYYIVPLVLYSLRYFRSEVVNGR